nr:Nramp family divalent metal transporter [Rhizobium sp. Pop5]
MLQISLGIVTSVGGFIETGQIATSSQAGAAYGFSLLWPIVIGTVCLIFLIEMSGRFAIASQHTVADGMRERFGANYFLFTLLIISIVNLLVLASEIGGITLALQFVSGVGFQWWALPVAFIVWLLLWKGTFGMIEDGVAIMGLVAVCFVVGVFVMEPPWLEVAKGLVPMLPDKEPLHYGFIAVSILGAVIAPFLFLFYSSGAIEEKWDKSFLGANRVISTVGMSFGAVIAASILIVAAVVFPPRGITDIEGYDQIAPLLTPAFGKWGFYLFAASLGITCFGAALEASLGQAYLVAQGFGWNWSEDAKPRTDPAFALVYTGFIGIAFLPIAFGVDPLQLTIFSMAITALALPFGVVPFLFLMNDRNFVGKHRNGWISNTAVLIIIGLSFIVALITLPLQIFGG